MNKKRIIGLLICLIVLGTGISIYAYQKELKNKQIILNKNTESDKKIDSLAIMVETGVKTGSYEQLAGTSWPDPTYYEFSSSKSACEKGSILTYDKPNNAVIVSTNKTDKCYVYFDVKIFGDRIVAKNGGAAVIEAKGTPNFANVATTNEGMYAAADDYGTSYYFRGAVDNNWIKFAGMYWRIVRINGDGTVKLIYSGIAAPTESQKVVMIGTGTQIGTSTFNNIQNNNMYLGYMYTSGEVHGTGTSSAIKTTIDNWYASKLASYSNYLADSIFCNDRSPYICNYYSCAGATAGGGTGTTGTYYGSYIRNVTNKAPILTCPNKSDAFTVSDTTKGNGALTNSVGLITADEVAMAGGVAGNTSNSSYYLYTNNGYWTGSPHYFHAGDIVYGVGFIVHPDGKFSNNNNVGAKYGVRPVVSLSTDIQVTGSGTWNDPYVVQ